jgi:hypothetical protein
MKMAEHLKNILGDMLYLAEPNESIVFLPSPEELQYKILVKAKKTVVKSVPKIVPPPVIKEEKDDGEENEQEEKSSSEKDIEFLPEEDSSKATDSIPGVDDGLFLNPKSQRWAGPPKVLYF